jgi:hypothetical protein
MTLPASGQISGSQIATELGVSATNISLAGMADTASFLSPDAYSDFYSYNGNTWSSFKTTANPQLTSALACSEVISPGRYHDGIGSNPVSGDRVRNNSDGTGIPASGYYMDISGWYRLDSNGLIIANGNCI